VKERTVSSNESSVSNDMTVIGRGTTIKGEVDFENGARILGVFEGKIRSQGEVQIGDTADCRAEIDAQRVVVEGTLQGDIVAHDRLRITKTAHLTGDIRAPKLVVEEGASFVGNVRVGDAAMQAPATRAGTPASASRPAMPSTPPADQVDFKPPWREHAEINAASTKKDPGLMTRVAETGAA